MEAKRYIYRNLRTGGFSVRYRGLVVKHLNFGIARHVTFKVNEAGRQGVIRRQQKDVHAFVVTSDEIISAEPMDVSALPEIKYNPYKGPNFTVNGVPILQAEAVLFNNGKCYLLC